MTEKKQQKLKDVAPKPSGFSFGATQAGTLAKASGKTAKVESPKDQLSGSK